MFLGRVLFKTFVLSGLLVACASSNNEIMSTYQKPDPKWNVCKVDSDCVKISGHCGVPSSVNRKYMNQMKDLISKNSKTYDCKPYKATRFSPNTQIGCEDKRCRLVFP